MGNEPICGQDTRDYRNSTYIVCGKQPQLRNSTSINIVNYIPVVSGPPLNFEKQQTFKKVERSASQFCQSNGLDNMYIPLVARIIAYGHNNIFMAYRKLPLHNKQQFLQEIKFADIDFLDSLYHKFILHQKSFKKRITLPSKIVERNKINQNDLNHYTEIGQKMLLGGQVAFIFLCAGSSSRFMFQQKFLYPLQLKNKKTMIELYLQKLRHNLKSNQRQKSSIPLIFACNQQNRNIIQKFLRERNYCNFDHSRIKYIIIPNLPVLNQNGKLCITFQYKILNRPSGTLKCIQQFLSSSLFNWTKNLKVNTLSILGCQNLSENPGDPLYLGYYRQNKLDILGKCTDPFYAQQSFNRYSGGNDGKTYLISTKNPYIGPQDILNCKQSTTILQTLLQKCPIAMNSIVCGLQQLKNMTRDYQNSMFLSLEYTAYKKKQNFYNFQKQKPIINQQVYVFQKQIGHLFTCTSKHALIKIPRQYYLPILSKNSSYSMTQACKKDKEISENSSNYSRITQY